MEINYEKVLKYSTQVGKRFLVDQELIQEVAQLTAIQFFLNEDKINSEKIDNWLFTVTKNYCLKKIKSMKNNKEFNFEPLLLESYPDNSVEYFEQEIDLDSYDFITVSDKIILQEYYIKQTNISEISRNYKIKLKKLKDKIYRLTQEMVLFHRMKDNFFASTISGTKLHNSIYYTVSKLKKALETNKIEKFANSLKNCIIHDNINTIEIRKILDICINFGSDNYYKALIIYKNFSDEYRAFLFKFVITDNSKLHILEIPIMPKIVATCKKSNVPKELDLDRKFPLKSGRSRITSDLLDQLIENKSLKVVQRGNNYED